MLSKYIKGIYEAERLDMVWLRLAILVGQVLASWITTLVNNPNPIGSNQIPNHP